MSEHSLLSPSKAAQWVACPASIARTKDIESPPSEYAAEGTAAHEMAASYLRRNPLIINEDQREMHGYVTEYVDTVQAMSAGASYVWIEESLDLSAVYGVPDSKGTGDYIAIVGDELQVHDLKYGRGVAVVAEGNYQLISYGLGALQIAELVDEIKTVRLVIHQPRLNSVSEVVYAVEELRAFGEELHAAAQAAMQLTTAPCCDIPEAAYNPGEKQCRFCAAKGTCEALARHCSALIVDDFEDLSNPAALDTELKVATAGVKIAAPAWLASIMANVDLIQGWIKAVEAASLKILLDGGDLPGFKLVEGRAGARKWNDEKVAEDTMKAMRLKLDEMYTRSLISPTVAEKLLKDKPRKWDRLQELINRKPGAPTIAPVSDKRPALSVSVKNDFQPITNEGGLE